MSSGPRLSSLAARVGVTVDEALAVKLVADAVGEIGVLPLLQETLRLLWDHVEKRQLRLNAYWKIAPGSRNAMQVAIDRRANSIYQNLPDSAQPIARRIFLRLIQFGEGRPDTRRQQTVEELRASGDDEEVFRQTLSRLIEARLLTSGGDMEGGARRVDIAHEALITSWARLQDWLKQRQSAEQFRRRLEEQAGDWLRFGKKAGLLDAFEIQEAENWLADASAQDLGYSQDLRELVSASKAALAAEAAEKEAQRQKELEQARALAEEKGRVADEQRQRAETAQRLVQGTLALGLASRAIEMAESRLVQDDLAALLAYQAYIFSSRSGNFAADRVDRALRVALGLPHFGGTLQGHEGVSALAFERTGRWLASGTARGAIEIWDLSHSDAIRTFLRGQGASPLAALECAGEIHWLWLAPGGGAVAAISGDGDVQVWCDWGRSSSPTRLTSAAQISEGTPPDWIPAQPPYAVAASHDQASFAYLGRDGTVWHVVQPEANRLAEPRPLVALGSCRALAFTSDDLTLVFVEDYEAGVTIQKIDSPESAPAHVRPEKWIVETDDRGATLKPIIALGPDGRALAQCPKFRSPSAPTLLWDLRESDTPAPHPLRDGEYYALWQDLTMQFGPRSEALAIASPVEGSPAMPSGESGEIRLWDVRRPSKKPFLMRGEHARCLAFSPTSDLLAAGGSATRLWRLRAADSATTALGKHKGAVRAIGFSPDSHTLVSCGEDELIRCWDLLHIDDDPIALDVHFWNARLGFHRLQRREYRPDSEPVPVPFPIVFSPDGRYIALTVVQQDQDRERECLCVPDLAHPDHPALFPSPAAANYVGPPGERCLGVFSAAFDTSSRSVITVEFDEDSFSNIFDREEVRRGFVRRWDLDHPDIVPGPIGQIAGLEPIMALSPGGRFLASAASSRVRGSDTTEQAWDTTVRLWDLSQPGQAPATLGQTNQLYSALAYRPDGQMFALGAESGDITLWDSRRLETNPTVLRGHNDRVGAIAFSPDGQMLASGSEDLTIRLWDLRQPKSYPIVLQGHEAGVSSVAFSTDGRLVASGSNDGIVRLWISQAEVLSELVRERLTRSLTRQEWDQFVGDAFEYEGVST